MIPYRQQEILQALADNKKGLTTPQIFKTASAAVGSELPDSSTVGKLCYSMRNSKPKLISTSDAVGGSVHKITGDGLAALAEAVGSKAQPQPQPKEIIDDEYETREDIELPPMRTTPEAVECALKLVINAGYTTLDPTNEIDTNFASIIEYIRMADALQPAPTIERKQEKIDALTRIAALMSDDIKFVLDAIANDLEQLESA